MKTRIQNPLIKKQVLQIRENLLCRTFAFKKNKRTSKFKKSSNKNSLSVEICATVISSEGYVVNDSKHPESVSKQPAGYYHFVCK